jgi:hypothetical protein
MSVLCDGQDISDCNFSRKSIFQLKKKNSYSGNILKILKDGVFADPDYQVITFRRCCNIKSKFALKLMVYRLKIYTAKLKREIRIRQKN